MNAVYKSIWNESLGTYVAAAESAASSGRRTSSVRQARRQPMRGGAQPMALEQRIVFDGALLATAGEVQLDAGDADVGVVDDVSTASPVELSDEAPAAASPTPAPSAAEEADASVPADTDTSADGSVDANESQNEPSAGGASDPVDAVGETGSLTGADAEVEAAMTLDAGGDGSGAVQTASGSDAAGLEGGGADAGLASPQLDDATLEATGDPVAGPAKEIVFVDAVAADLAQVLNTPEREVVILDANRDGVEQIAQVLAGRSDITAVHIVSHGVEGQLMLGNTVLNAESMSGRYAGTLGQIGTALSEDADILIYGCNFGEGEDGLGAASLLAQFTGADVAASDDTTGHESRGGDWDLEVQVGDISTATLRPLAWDGVLDLVIQNVGTVGELALANAIMGSGVTVTSATYSGGANQAGIFTTGAGLQFGSNILEFTEGAIFTTNANTSSVGGTNTTGGLTSDAPGIDGDADFVALSPGYASFDASFIVIHFTPDVFPGASVGDTGRMTASIVFGSEEYNEYVYGGFNDTLGVWVNGVNVATVSNGLSIGIDTVNDAANFNPASGSVANDPNPEHTSASFESANPNLYINNETGAYITQMDGFTVTLSLTFNVTVGVDNEIKLGIADTGDASYDSWLFVKAESLQTSFVAENDSVSTPTNVPLTFDVTANDVDQGGGTLNVVAINGNAISPGGVVTLASGITLTMGTGGVITAQGDGINAVTDTFTYTVSNGSAQTTSATVVVEMTPVNSAPVANNDSFTVAEDGSVGINVLANDSDANGDTLTITQVDGQAITDGGAAVTVANGSVALVSGQLVFAPTADYNGPASFSYTVSDGFGTSTANVTGTVTPVNDAPVASNDGFTVAEDGSLAINVLANDTDIDGDALTITQVDGQAISDGGASVSVVNGSVALVGGQLVFTPAANYNGPASFSYTVSDGSLTSTATVSGSVTPVNDAPVANNDSFTVAEDGSVTIDVLANDSDIDGDALTVTQVDGQAITDGGATVAVANGSVSLVGGQLVFTPAANYNGPASFSYTVSDGSLTSTATVSGSVTPVNDALVANNDSFTVAEDGSVTIDVLANDSDIDGDALTVTQVDGQAITDGGAAVAVANGSVSLVGGQLVFTPSTNYNGPASFSYTVSDGTTTASANVSGTVTPVNDAPVATNDSFTVAEDGSVTIDVLANDTDVDGDALTVTQVDGQAITDGGASVSVTNGSVALLGGQLVFAPAANYSGPVSFAYTVSDGLLTSTASVSGTVTPVNDAPVANNDSFTMAEDGSVTIDVLANDTDVDGDTPTVTQVDGQAITDGGAAVAVGNGSVSLVGGQMVFTPAANYSGPVSFAYTVSDGLLTSTASVSGTVTPVNDAPVASNDSFTVTEDGSVTIDVLANDTDVDGDTLTVTQVDGQAITEGGAAVSVINGSVSLVGGQLVFTPASNYNGPASFSYTVSDGTTTASANVSGTVTPVNDAPVASNDSFTVAEDGSVTIDVLANDTDVDGDALTVTQVDGQAITDGGASVSVTNGSVALLGGQLVFAPAANYSGPVSFAYTVSDGLLTSTASVSGTVTPVNDAPVANNDSFTMAEDGSVTIDVLANDTDVDGDTPTVTQVDGQAITDGGAAVAVGNGSVSLVGGQLVFTPAANYNGPAAFSYTVSDGFVTSTANVSGTVTAANDAPVANNDSFTVAEDGSVSINVLANDTDIDGDSLTITQVDGQAITDGGASVSVTNGSVSLVSGQLVFTPSANYNGPASFSYTVSDGTTTASANVSGTVTPVNDIPVASNDSFTVAEDGSVTIDVLANDTDVDGDTLTVTQVDGQAITDGGASVSVANGSVSLVGGQLVFTPAANYNGPAAFSYTVSDGTTTASANVSGTVAPVYDAPVATNDSFTVAEDGSVTFDVLANDTDIDGDSLTITQIDGQVITDGGAAVVVTNGSVVLLGGQLVFTPSANYNGPASFSYTVSDGTTTASANVSGTVTPVNDAPVATNDSFTVAEDGSVTIDVLANDTDIDGDVLTVTQVDGQLIGDGGASVSVANGSVALVGGQLVFTPVANYNGSASFSYTVSDGTTTASANVSGTVTPANDVPVANNDSFTVAEDGSVTFDVLANDTDVDGNALTVTQVNGQAVADGGAAVGVNNGSVALLGGQLVFTPSANYNGPAAFSYTVSDGTTTASANVSGTVTPVNDTPVASNDSFTVAEGGSVTIDVLANDTDVDGDALTVTQVDGQAIGDGGASVSVTNGSVSLLGGQLVFMPAANYNGPASFSYTVSDGSTTASANVSGTVTPVNDAPVANNDSFTVAEDGSVTFDVLANDTDLDGDMLTVTQVDGQAITDGGAAVGVTNGSVALLGGQLVFTPSANYNGPAAFSYTVSDGTTTVTANVSGTVTPVNDTPGAGNDSFTVAEDGSVTIDVLANDTDVDGDALNVTQVNGLAITEGGAAVSVANGSVALVGGQLVFTPAANFNGPASFSYTVSDGTTTASANVSGTVTPANDAPVASNDSFTVAEDGSVTIDVLANDNDIDGDALTITQVNGQAIIDGGPAVSVANGSVSLVAGQLVFKPAADYNGPVSFDYTASDGQVSSSASVGGEVTPVFDAPPAKPEAPVSQTPVVQTPEPVSEPRGPSLEVRPVGSVEGIASSQTPISPLSPEIHVLSAVEGSRVESALVANGLTIENTDRVLMAEAMTQVPDNLLLDQPADSADLSVALGGGLVEGGVRPEVYVQRAVRHEALTHDHGLFVQRAVRSSILQSRVDDMRIAELSAKFDELTSWAVERTVVSDSQDSPESRQPQEEGEQGSRKVSVEPQSEEATDERGIDAPARSLSGVPVETGADAPAETTPRAAAKGFRAQLREMALQRNGVVPPLALRAAEAQNRLVSVASSAMR